MGFGCWSRIPPDHCPPSTDHRYTAAMDSILQILVLTAFLAGGALCVKFRWAPPAKVTDIFIKIALWALLFVMGFRTGNDPEVASRIGRIGILGAAAAAASLAGTIAAILAGYALLGLIRKDVPRAARRSRADPAASGDSPAAGAGSQLRTSLLLLSVVAGGGFAGVILPPLEGVDLGAITGWVLNALLFFVGMQFAQSGISFKAVFLRPDTLMIPVATAVGSILGGLALAPVFRLPAGHAMSLTAGFGWYTLSGVLIANLGNPVLGSAAFLANLFRESLAFVTIPLLARTSRPYLAIGAGGATAMDVTLPLIEQCVGPESVPASFASGALLSLSVPVLVPFLFGLGV
mgnify:CR=1 FL=1